MPLQTHRNKEDKKMYKVLLETGELKEFRTLKAAIRKSVVINGKKQILYISENVGLDRILTHLFLITSMNTATLLQLE